ncbi:probable polygalacturonase At3g15720 [Macadamia integrifolia]|uniref:probable polygalacturonase At3g15720 n=1 Tax=Macadamia integrifolia TaxID=60698 RepID=UPI001C52EB6E|nr:probable polygalacturonase At3g15720 [Macadamia integrifolia]
MGFKYCAKSSKDHITIFLILCIALLISGFGIAQPNSFDVMSYQAVGDGITDDSEAFLKSWAAVCGADPSATPTLTIPSGKTFLLKPTKFYGPCKPQKINVEVSGSIVAPDSKSGYEGHNEWLSFKGIDGLNISGTGEIDGRGSVWWQKNTALAFHCCNGLQLSGLKHMNSPKNHISINNCTEVIISLLNITAPQNSPNTDGIDISASTHVLIRDSCIGTGDDCVAINSGSSFINITNVTCGPGHGISVGSLGENGAHHTVEEVHVNNCSFNGTMNGARIKTWQGGSGYAKNISFEQITLVSVKNPIIIDQYYIDRNSPQNATNVEVSNVTFIGFHGTTTSKNAITLKCCGSVGCTNIVLNQINITAVLESETSSICSNAHGKATDFTAAPPPPPAAKEEEKLAEEGKKTETGETPAPVPAPAKEKAEATEEAIAVASTPTKTEEPSRLETRDVAEPAPVEEVKEEKKERGDNNKTRFGIGTGRGTRSGS